VEGTLKIFSGNSNRALAEEICRYLKRPLGDADVLDFADGETWVRINENIRGDDVFVIQSTNAPARNIMELLIMLDAIKRASPHRVTAVIPYFGYARQDRKDQPRVPITAKLMANLITTAGADRVLTMDLHSAQIQGFFDIPLDNLYAGPTFIHHCRESVSNNLVVVSPDMGNVKRARAYATHLQAPLAIIDKDRPQANVSVVKHILGEPISGKSCVIFDDMVDTAGTLCNAAEALMEAGAKDVRALCTHGVLSGPALERVARSVMTELVVSDTIPLDGRENGTPPDKIKVLTLAPLFAQAIERIHTRRSVSALFDV
jgi:ribose-phosphate pyrophosphokinase